MRTSIWMAALALVAGTASAQQRAQAVGGDAAADTLRITRRQAVATALLANPQLEIAREQTFQVRAQRVESIAIPDPTLVNNAVRLTPTLTQTMVRGKIIEHGGMRLFLVSAVQEPNNQTPMNAAPNKPGVSDTNQHMNRGTGVNRPER